MMRNNKLNDMNKTQNTPPHSSLLPGKLRNWLNTINERSHLANACYIRVRPLVRPTVYVFIILLIATLAIWRTSLPYIDDLSRDYNGGYAFSYAFARHSPSLLMYFLNMDFTLQNLSPLTQILAMLLVAIACVTITYTLCHKKVKYLPLTFSTLIAINPLALGCWMFQYDAPGMALSILSTALPILFWYRLDDLFSSQVPNRSKLRMVVIFIIFSSLSLLVMWTSYQASSGLLPLLVLTICLVDILRNTKLRPTLLKALLYVVPYLMAAGLFLVIYNLSSLDNYRDASATSISNLLPTVVNNLSMYLSTTWQHLNGSWRILVLTIAISFVIACLLTAEQKMHFARNGILSIVYLIIALPLSYGAYLILSSPASQNGASSTFGRTAIGLGFVIALVCTTTAIWIDINKQSLSRLLYLPGLCLLIAFISYNTAFANAYDDQLSYNKFRTEEVIEDIADIYPEPRELNKKQITVYSYSNLYSGEMAKLIESHPIVTLITSDMETWLTKIYFGKIPQLNTSIKWRWGSHYKKECNGSKLKNSTYYHTIREKDNGDICVYLK